MTASTTRPAGSSAPAAGNAPPTMKLPYVNAAVSHIEDAFDKSFTLQAAAVTTVDLIDIPAVPGVLRAINLDITATTAGNGAATAFLADGPFSVIQDLSFVDTAGAPTIGPLGGYDAYLIHKYGGYRAQVDPKLSPLHSVTTGAGATGGSFRFRLRIPVEILARDGFGALYNSNNSTPYRLRLNLAPASAVYSVNPTAMPTIRVSASIETFFDPGPADYAGRPVEEAPPGAGTTQYWSRFASGLLPTGRQTFSVKKVGNHWRNLIVVFRDSAGLRQAANVPADLSLYQDTRPIFIGARATDDLRIRTAEAAGLITATAEAAGGPDNGVVVWPDWCSDLNGRMGNEMRSQYLPTALGTRLDLQATLPVANTIWTVLLNEVAGGNGVLL